jgi:hypothetical protein
VGVLLGDDVPVQNIITKMLAGNYDDTFNGEECRCAIEHLIAHYSNLLHEAASREVALQREIDRREY